MKKNGTNKVVKLTEERVREIAREEIRKYMVEHARRVPLTTLLEKHPDSSL